MKIPNDTNKRAEHMWRQISREIDFRNKYVVDLGCGHGEMLWRMFIAGAIQVRGYDIDHQKSGIVYGHLEETSETVITTAHIDINNWVKNDIQLKAPWKFDIAICFSVLPYLDNPGKALKWMAKNFPTTLLEVQYYPEPYNIGINSDGEMRDMLFASGFESVEVIGKTFVSYRNVYRTIWKCNSQDLTWTENSPYYSMGE